jgi:hypothetical protein
MDGWCRGGERLRVSEEVQVIVGIFEAFEVRVGEDGRELEKKRKRVMTMMMQRCCHNEFGIVRLPFCTATKERKKSKLKLGK